MFYWISETIFALILSIDQKVEMLWVFWQNTNWTQSYWSYSCDHKICLHCGLNKTTFGHLMFDLLQHNSRLWIAVRFRNHCMPYGRRHRKPNQLKRISIFNQSKPLSVCLIGFRNITFQYGSVCLRSTEAFVESICSELRFAQLFWMLYYWTFSFNLKKELSMNFPKKLTRNSLK